MTETDGRGPHRDGTNQEATDLEDPNRRTLQTTELRSILEQNELFSELSDDTCESLCRAGERFFVPAGTAILSEGEVPEWAYVVEHGRLRCKWGLHLPLLGDLGRGDVFGIGSVLARTPVSGDVVALRDVWLIRIPAAELPQLVARHLDLLTAYSRWQHDVALRSHGLGAARALPNAFAILPLGEQPEVVQAGAKLCEALDHVGSVPVVIDAARVRQILRIPEKAQIDFEQAPPELLAWCEKREAGGSSLLFVCDPADTAWTRWCIRQTDKIVAIARADTEVGVADLARRFAGRMLAGSPLQLSLLLVQDDDCDLPTSTRRWLELGCLRGHHHVRIGEPRDFDRAARRLCEKPVGVVLGGGGARGFAHVGVLEALEDAGIAIDHVGGTSMGSIMAASYARGWKPEQILEIIAGLFTRSRAVIDPDVPMVSMLSGRKLDRILEELFGEADISDLWLPCYAVSASLTHSRMVVHDRGRVWQALRASASLPGVYPPARIEGQLLVDGGLVNNVPIDVMRSRCGAGAVVAVDVGAGGGNEFEIDRDIPTGWELLKSRLSPWKPHVAAPSIGKILVGSTMLSSKRYLDLLLDEGRVDLFLKLPVQDFELLEFGEYRRLYEVGYEVASKALAEAQL